MTNRFVCSREFLDFLQQNFVAATCCKKSNQTEFCVTCRGDKILLQRQRFSQNLSSTLEAICCCEVSPKHVEATCNCCRICTWTQTRSDLSQSLQLVCSTPTPIPAGGSCPAGRVTCHIATKEKLCVHWPVVCWGVALHPGFYRAFVQLQKAIEHEFLRSTDLLNEAMAESEQAGRTVVLGVDASEHSERAFDCKWKVLK